MAFASAIYRIDNTKNGKFYVGSALHSGRRKIEHWRDLRAGKHGNVKLQRAWDKYGEDSFVFTVLEKVDNPADLLKREQFWIDELQAVKRGYNIAPTAGSLFGFRQSADARRRMSDSHKRLPRRSKEHSDKLRQALTGRIVPPEQIEKMRIAKLGRKRGPMREEHRSKIALANKGRALTTEHKAKLAQAKQGKPWSAARRQAYEASRASPS